MISIKAFVKHEYNSAVLETFYLVQTKAKCYMQLSHKWEGECCQCKFQTFIFLA